MYKDLLLDHYRNPRNRDVLEAPDFVAELFNPLCGDVVVMQGNITEGTISRCVFTGKGCVLSQATASLLTEWAVGKSLQELLSFNKNNLCALVGIDIGPVRLKCVLLSLEALHTAVEKFVHTTR